MSVSTKPTAADRFRLKPLVLALCGVMALPAGPAGAQALPGGASVVHGQASIATQPGRLTVTTGSQNTILNWQNFSIGATSSVRFDQPNPSSQVLNRVLGNDPSQIFGQLSSNGRVWLLNPNGVLFGANARVDVAGLVASTLNLNDADWQARRYNLLARETPGTTASATVVNQGELRSAFGGHVMLIGGAGGVRNEGLIDAPGGRILLAAGHSVDLGDSSMPDIAVRVTAPQGQVLNLGRLSAAGGQVDLQAAMINQSGIVRADALAVGPAGQIMLRASDSTLVSGDIGATSGHGTGGRITLLGPQVGVLDGASVDASGQLGGGSVFVGGGRQGQDPGLANARAVYFAPGASIRADAGERGDGGSIVLWSDRATRAFGSLSARGGLLGGDGGFIETSGGWLDARPASIRTDAAHGKPGQWLLDPNDILITDFLGSPPIDPNFNVGPDFTSTGDSAVIYSQNITSALNSGNNVTITTATQPGDIGLGDVTFSGANIIANPSKAVTLKVDAQGSIFLYGSTIQSNGKPLNLNLSAAGSGLGSIRLVASTIDTRGGNITLGGPSATFCGVNECVNDFAGAIAVTDGSSRLAGVEIVDSMLDAGSGSIRITGAAGQGLTFYEDYPIGITIGSGSSLSAADITLRGRADVSGQTGGYGVSVESSGGGDIRATGKLNITGDVVIDGVGGNEWGVAGIGMGALLRTDIGTQSGASITLKGSFTGDQPPGGNEPFAPRNAIWFDGGVRAGAGSSVNIVGDGAAITLRALFGFQTGSAASVSISGDSFLGVLSPDIQVPNGGRFSVLTKRGVDFSSVTVNGNPSSATIDVGDSDVIVGATCFECFPTTLNLGGATLSISGGRLLIGDGVFPSSIHAGRITIQADEVQVRDTSNITATVSGDALRISGLSGNTKTFINESTFSGGLVTPNGRWRVWAADPRDSQNFQPGGLIQDFTQYDAVFGQSSPQGSGNGFLFSLAPKLTLTGPSGITKVYDGTTTVTPAIDLDQIQVTGLLPGDSLKGTFSANGVQYTDKNVGAAIPIAVSLDGGKLSVVDGSDRPVYGYTLKDSSRSFTGSITPRPLTLLGVTAADKVYDGTRTATLTGGSFSGLVGNETLGFQDGAALFDTQDAGVGKTVSATALLADGSNGGLVSNYAVTGNGTVSTTATITPKPVSAGSLIVVNKVYDGSTTATVSGGTVIGTVGGETLTLLLGPGQFDSKDVGTYKPVTATGTLANGSGLASNYVLSNGVAAGSGDITPRPVTVSGISAESKVYDGTRTASLSGGSFVGLVDGETLVLSSTGLFDTKDAGTGKTVTATVTLGNGSGLASNYLVADAGLLTTTANITPKLLTVAGLSAATREYDGSRAVKLAGTGTLSGLVGTEMLSFTLVSGLFDSQDAGVGKTVNATLKLEDGGNGGRAGNYTLPNEGNASFSGTILPKSLTVSGVAAADKVYDGSTAASVSVGSVQGLVGNETLAITPLGRFEDKNAGSDKTVTLSLDLQDGSNGGKAANYALSGSAVTSADILPRAVTLSGLAAQNKTYDGTATATLAAATIGGLVTGESLTIAAQATFNDKNVGQAKPVSGTFTLGDGVGAGGGQASNYQYSGPTTFSGSAAIDPRPLAVTAATASGKVYDSTRVASVGNFALGGVLPGEQVIVAAGSGQFDNANVGANKAVQATATTLGGADAGNYRLGTASFGTTATITPATLSYLATPTALPVGTPIAELPGFVTGFVGTDSLQSATTGVASFTSTANASSPEGRYPINGSGLQSGNYVFVQAAGNASALSLVNLPTGLLGDVATQALITPQIGLANLPMPVVSSFSAHRSADVLQALAPANPTSSGPVFSTVDLSALSINDVGALLNARDRYKREIFAEAILQLERDPTLADAPSCQTVEQAAAGNCLITEALKPALRARIAQAPKTLPMPLPAPASAAAPATVPSPVVAVAPAATTVPAAPAAAPPVVAIARPAPPLAATAIPAVSLPARRPVKSASVPQIQRKLALVIGTDDYADARIPKLDNAVSDAVAVGEVLEKSLGYQTVVVRNGSKQAIVSAFNLLAAQVAPQDSVIIYYAGHGELLKSSGLGYWQPANADASRPETWLSNSDIGKLLAQVSASQVALISDSCFSGSLVSDERIRGIPQTGDPSALLSRRAAVVMSSGGNEPVSDAGKNGHSTFAWSLMRTIEKVSTWRPGSSVFEQVRFAVARELPQRPLYGASRLGGHQTGADYLFEERQLEGGPR